MSMPNEESVPVFVAPASLVELDERVTAALDTIRNSRWANWADAADKRYHSDVRRNAERDVSTAAQWLQNLEATARMRDGRTRGDQL